MAKQNQTKPDGKKNRDKKKPHQKNAKSIAQKTDTNAKQTASSDKKFPCSFCQQRNFKADNHTIEECGRAKAAICGTNNNKNSKVKAAHLVQEIKDDDDDVGAWMAQNPHMLMAHTSATVNDHKLYLDN